jgi:hypothetical protein
MDKDYIDKYIKESLYNHETKIDNDLLWAAIEQKKSRGGTKIFGILGMLAVLLVAGFALFQMQDNFAVGDNLKNNIHADNDGNSQSLNNNNSSAAFKNKANQTQSLILSREMSQENGNTITQLDENTLFIESDNSASISISNNNSSPLNSNSNNPHISNGVTENETLANNDALSNNTSGRNTSSSSVAYRDASNRNNNNQNNKVGNTNNSSNFSLNNKSNNTTDTTSDQSTASSSTDNTSTTSKSIVENATGVNTTSRQIESLEQLESQMIFLNTEALMFPSYQPSDCPTFGTKKRNLYLQAYTIFDFINYSFASSSDNINYRNERERTQSYSPSFRAGLQAKYLFKNGLYVKAGFEYGVVRERYKDRIVDTLVTIEPNQLISFFETSPGDTTFIYGNAPVTTISASNWNVQNSYKTIDIPIMVGYQISKGNWTYGLELGVLNNIRLTTKSFILDTALKPRLAPEYYKSSIKQSLIGGINLGYSLTPDIKLLGLLQFKQNLSFINSNVNPIDQKNLHIGLGAGVEYRF